MDAHSQGDRANARFQRALTPCSPDYCVDLTEGPERDTPMWQHPTAPSLAPHGAIHVPQCPRGIFAGSLNRILEEPVPVYAQSDTVFQTCLQLQKYLIEPITRPITADLHPAELIADYSNSLLKNRGSKLGGSSSHSSAATAAATITLSSICASRRTCSGELYNRSMRTRTQRWHHQEHEGLSQSYSGSGHDHPGYRS